MKKIISILMALMMLVVLFGVGVAEAATVAPTPMFTVNVTQLIIAIMWMVFNVLLAWLLKAVIPPLKTWLTVHTTSEQQNRVWTMIKWLVEAAEQTITGYAKGGKRLEWVQAQLKARGIDADLVLIEAAVKEMKDNASKEIKQVIDAEDFECEACKISFDDGK